MRRLKSLIIATMLLNIILLFVDNTAIKAQNKLTKSANEKSWTIDTVYVFNVELQPTFSRHIYVYNSEKLIVQILTEIWQNNSWETASQYLCRYNKNNKALNKVSQNWQNDTWVNTFQYIYTYDENNNRLSELSQKWKNDTWINYRQILNNYDENNNEISFVWKFWQNDDWLDYYKRIFIYNIIII